MEVVSKGFDEALWKQGVDAGAFAGLRDPQAAWYILEASGVKVALASAVPGPGDLTSISYFVPESSRGLGYGTKIASRVTDLHEKSSFLMMKQNEPSVKVALAALRGKFSMTLGHNTVRLTKTASKKKGDDRLDDLKSVGASMAGVAVSQVANNAALRKTIDSPERLTFADRRELRSISGEHPVIFAGGLPVGGEHTLTAEGVRKAVVVASTHSPKDIVLHEIGHAKTLTKPVLGPVLHASRRVSEILDKTPVSARAATSAAAVAVMAHDPESPLAKAMPYALAASMPHVGNIPAEVMASGYAIGNLLSRLQLMSAAKGLGRLAFALGTYAGPAASVGVSMELLRRYLAKNEKNAADQIPGGKADKKKPSDFDAAALAEGAKHEREHTSSDSIAEEIAMDHLTEDPEYYVKLRKIEKKAASQNHERNTINTTLTGKIHESFTVAADRIQQAGMLSPKERMELSRAIGEMLGNLRRKMNPDVGSREMTPHAHDLLKGAATERGQYILSTARMLAKRKSQPSGYQIGEIANVAKKKSVEPLAAEAKGSHRGVLKLVGNNPENRDRERAIRKLILGKIPPQMELGT